MCCFFLKNKTGWLGIELRHFWRHVSAVGADQEEQSDPAPIGRRRSLGWNAVDGEDQTRAGREAAQR
jgi:hypothetical protein